MGNPSYVRGSYSHALDKDLWYFLKKLLAPQVSSKYLLEYSQQLKNWYTKILKFFYYFPAILNCGADDFQDTTSSKTQTDQSFLGYQQAFNK